MLIEFNGLKKNSAHPIQFRSLPLLVFLTFLSSSYLMHRYLLGAIHLWLITVFISFIYLFYRFSWVGRIIDQPLLLCVFFFFSISRFSLPVSFVIGVSPMLSEVLFVQEKFVKYGF